MLIKLQLLLNPKKNVSLLKKAKIFSNKSSQNLETFMKPP